MRRMRSSAHDLTSGGYIQHIQDRASPILEQYKRTTMRVSREAHVIVIVVVTQPLPFDYYESLHQSIISNSSYIHTSERCMISRAMYVIARELYKEQG